MRANQIARIASDFKMDVRKEITEDFSAGSSLEVIAACFTRTLKKTYDVRKNFVVFPPIRCRKPQLCDNIDASPA